MPFEFNRIHCITYYCRVACHSKQQHDYFECFCTFDGDECKQGSADPCERAAILCCDLWYVALFQIRALTDLSQSQHKIGNPMLLDLGHILDFQLASVNGTLVVNNSMLCFPASQEWGRRTDSYLEYTLSAVCIVMKFGPCENRFR